MRYRNVAWVFYALIASATAVYLATGSLAGSALAWVIWSAVFAGAAWLLSMQKGQRE